MKEKTRRRRKNHPHYMRIAFAILILVLLITLAALGIKNVIKNNNAEELGNTRKQQTRRNSYSRRYNHKFSCNWRYNVSQHKL